MAIKTKKTERLMYIGPTIVTLDLINNSVYENIPVTAKEAVSVFPIFKALFIPIERYPQANKNLRERIGIEYQAFKKINEIKSKGGF